MWCLFLLLCFPEGGPSARQLLGLTPPGSALWQGNREKVAAEVRVVDLRQVGAEG